MDSVGTNYNLLNLLAGLSFIKMSPLTTINDSYHFVFGYKLPFYQIQVPPSFRTSSSNISEFKFLTFF